MTTKESRSEIDNINLLFGKIPPQATDLEKAVLGALLIDNEAIYEVMDIINEQSFYDPNHQVIYSAIKKLSKLGKPIDILTVANELKATDNLNLIGGEVYLSELTDRVATSSNIDFHSRIIEQKAIQRRLISSSAEIQKMAYDDNIDVDDVISFAEKKIHEITDTTFKQDLETATNLVTESLNDLEIRSQQKASLIGLPSGFTEIDRLTSGFQSPDLIIIAARPSMGKSAFMLNIAKFMAIDTKKTVAIFSLEMSKKQLSDRLIIAESEINSFCYRTGKLTTEDWTKIESTSTKLLSDNLLIDDTAAISIVQLRSKCRKLARTKGLHAVVIDYLQLMTTGEKSNNREQEISFISRSLKQLAKELNIPIIALSQLNRSVESRADKRPQLSDLRESGAIEQDADMVIFIHRPEYYGLKQDENQESTEGIAEIIIAKYRNGATGIIKLKFVKELIKFENKDIKPAYEIKPERNEIPNNTEFDIFDTPF